MLLVLFAELVVEVIDGVDFTVEEDVVLEALHVRWSIRSAEVKTNISFLLDVFVLGVVLWLAEALHEGLETGPVPVGFGDHFLAHCFCKSFG